MSYVYNNTLQHHGILGQRWGVRRYQNEDGTLTEAGKKRYGTGGTESSVSSTTNNTVNKKAVAAVGIGAATTIAAAYYVHENPEAIGKVISQVKDMKVGDISQAIIKKGKEYVSEALSSAKEGAKEGLKEAPKKATKAVVTGAVMNGTKKALDSIVGTEESAKIFQANDNKKIGKFWKVSPEDKEDDD